MKIDRNEEAHMLTELLQTSVRMRNHGVVSESDIGIVRAPGTTPATISEQDSRNAPTGGRPADLSGLVADMRAAVADGQARLAELPVSEEQVSADKLLASILAGTGKRY